MRAPSRRLLCNECYRIDTAWVSALAPRPQRFRAGTGAGAEAEVDTLLPAHRNHYAQRCEARKQTTVERASMTTHGALGRGPGRFAPNPRQRSDPRCYRCVVCARLKAAELRAAETACVERSGSAKSQSELRRKTKRPSVPARHRRSLSSCPSWARTRTLLIQNVADRTTDMTAAFPDTRAQQTRRGGTVCTLGAPKGPP
jgi:hypothetical protein